MARGDVTEPPARSGDPAALRARADEVLELHDAGHLDQALQAAEQLEADAAAGDLSDEIVRESLFAARFQRAMVLIDFGELDRAAEAYGRAAAVPADPEDPDQLHEIAMALLNRGVCLDAIGDPQAALATYDELIERFGGADDPVTADQVVRARTNRAATLRVLSRPEDAIAAVRDLAAQLDDAAPLDVEQLVVGRRIHAASAKDLGRLEEALTAVEGLPGGGFDDPGVAFQRAAADHDRAELLLDLDRPDEARRVLDELSTSLDRADPEEADLAAEVEATRRRLPAGD